MFKNKNKGIIVQQEQVFPRSETWINLAPLKLLWDLDPALVDLAGDVGAPFGHGPVLGPANVRTYSSPEVLWKHAFSAAGHADHAAHHADQLVMLISWPLQVMLSSVQAYKGGYMAGQQHAWQVGFEMLNYS